MRDDQRRGFTMLELFVVMALMAALVVVLLATYAGVVQAWALNSAAGSLNDVLMEGREAAVTRNTTVEVRLYDLPDEINAGGDYRALQLHFVAVNGTWAALGSTVFLPAAVVLDATAQHSSVIACDPVTATADSGDRNMNAQTRVFHFLSDGSTDLTAGATWFLTLRSAAQSDPANFPGNWASVSVDPVTGRTQIFRP